MSLSLAPVVPPLRIDAQGVCRVAGTRVPLESLLWLFEQGAAAEDIAQAFPSVSLPDVYATIAYYLAHREAVDEYLEAAAQREDAARSEMRSRFPMTEVRERLLARRRPISA